MIDLNEDSTFIRGPALSRLPETVKTDFDLWLISAKRTPTKYIKECMREAWIAAIQQSTALVKAATAEECAKVCESETWGVNQCYERTASRICAEAIRTKYRDQTKSSGEKA